jgi:hypothetical protein
MLNSRLPARLQPWCDRIEPRARSASTDGEYTFAYSGYQAHGVTVIQLRQGRIARWREYEVASAATWGQFTRANPF